VKRVPSSRVLVVVAVLGAALLVTSCGDLGAPEPATEQGDSFVSTWRVFLYGAIAVALLIWVLVLVAVVRFRRRSDRYPNQKQYNIPFEVVYTTLPLVAVAGLFTLTVFAENRFTELADDPDLRVEVTGYQWGWQFTYPDQGITVTSGASEEPTLMLPVGQTVQLHLVTRDVIHSFWVPEFLEKRDLIPQVDNTIDVEIVRPGEWTGRCAEYCGLDHWQMRFTTKAVDEAEFDRWVDEARQQPQPIVAGTDADLAGGGA
jgi:cytochrome c oxidase subunit 2